jgi:hypothetical protein|nr:hypothetical protein [uncultured Prevotella sp.]
MKKKVYITPQTGAYHIKYSTVLLAGSPTTSDEIDIDPGDGTITPVKKEDPNNPLPGQITGAKQWNAWDWGEQE